MDKNRILSQTDLNLFGEFLLNEEKSIKTAEKYMRDAGNFFQFAKGMPVQKSLAVSYKNFLQEQNYSIRPINSMPAPINCLFTFMGWTDCKVKSLKMQRQIYCPEEKELSKDDYYRLLSAAKSNSRLSLIIQSICSTGIRVSELRFFTVESIKTGEISVRCKNKTRTILIPRKQKNSFWNTREKTTSKAVLSLLPETESRLIEAISGHR